MKIKHLFLCLFLIVVPVQSSANLHFLRKIIAIAAGLGVAYKFEQDKAEEVVKVLHEELNTQIDFAFHTKFTNEKKFKKCIMYPAYALRGLTGLLTFVSLNYLLNHE